MLILYAQLSLLISLPLYDLLLLVFTPHIHACIYTFHTFLKFKTFLTSVNQKYQLLFHVYVFTLLGGEKLWAYCT